MRKLLLISLLLWVPSAYAQSVRYQSQVIGSRGLPLANQNVAVCTQPANTSTQPCSPLATLATSTSTTSGGANPLTTDINGNFFFYAAPGTYTIQIYGPQIVTPFVQPDTLVGATGVGTFTSINKIVSVDQQAGATADVQLTNCNTALPSGGICDARGYGATTQSFAAQWTAKTGVRYLFDPNTIFQAASSALNPVVVKTNSQIDGLHFDCGNQPTYSGNVFTFNDNYRDGNRTAVEHIQITCSGVTTGTAALLASSGTTQPIVWVRLSHWRQFGLLNQVLLTATGNGFVNDNHFSDMQMTGGGGTSVQMHYTTNNGQLNANQCIQCSFESASATDLAELFDGTTGANDQASNNLYIGDGWDTTVAAINYSGNSKATKNQAIGFFNNGISDTNLANGMNFVENVGISAGLYLGGAPGQAGTTQTVHNSSSAAAGVTGTNYCMVISAGSVMQCQDTSGNLGTSGNYFAAGKPLLTSTYTNATTTPSNIPGLSFPVAANTNYTMSCTLYYQGSASTAGLDVTLTGPASPTSVVYGYIEEATATGGAQGSVATAFGTKLTGAGAITATTNFTATVTMGLRNGANAGTVQIQGSASGAGTVTVQPGSYCKVE